MKTQGRSCGEVKRVWRRLQAHETLLDTSQGLVLPEQKHVVSTARAELDR